MNRSTLAFILLGATAAPVLADYQFQLDGSYESLHNDFNNGPTLDTETFNATATYYLKPISTGNNEPLHELAFLQQASSGYANVNFVDHDSRSTQDDETNVVLGGRYVLPDNGYFAQTRLSFGEEDSIQLSIGRYLDSHTTVAGHYEVDGGISEFNVNFKKVVPISSGAMAGNYVNMEASGYRSEFGDNESSLGVMVGADLYLTRELGVGGRLNLARGDLNHRSLGLNGTFYPNEQFGIFASYEIGHSEPDGGPDSDLDGFTIGVTGRF